MRKSGKQQNFSTTSNLTNLDGMDGWKALEVRNFMVPWYKFLFYLYFVQWTMLIHLILYTFHITPNVKDQGN